MTHFRTFKELNRKIHQCCDVKEALCPDVLAMCLFFPSVFQWLCHGPAWPLSQIYSLTWRPVTFQCHDWWPLTICSNCFIVVLRGLSVTQSFQRRAGGGLWCAALLTSSSCILSVKDFRGALVCVPMHTAVCRFEDDAVLVKVRQRERRNSIITRDDTEHVCFNKTRRWM